MSDIGQPLRRYHGVPREDPMTVPEVWPEPAAPAPVDPPATPVVDPEREPAVLPA
jgi:hypothetical protein